MMFIIFITLAIALLLVIVAFAAMFVDVAFDGPGDVRQPCGVIGNWQPPMLRGRELLRWAAETAEKATLKRLSGQRAARTAEDLTVEMYEGTSHAIHESMRSNVAGDKSCSPAYCYSMIAVTPPEVIGISEHIRDTKLPEEIEDVLERALANTGKTPNMGQTDYAGADIRCPLLGADDSCLAYAVRPIRCRRWCAWEQERETAGPSEPHGGTSKVADRDWHDHESRSHLVIEGAEYGFCRGLQSAGLDGNLYELNSALATALQTDDAAAHWVNGDWVFEDCKLYH